LNRTGRLDQDSCRQLLPVLVAVARALPCAKERRHAA